jgi:hypothetical protein
MTLSLLISGKMFVSPQPAEQRQQERGAGSTVD